MIDDVSRDIDRALSHVRASWTDERAWSAQRRVHRRLRRRARVRLAAAGAATLGIGLFVSGLLLRGQLPSAPTSTEVVLLSRSELRLADGSHGVVTRPGSQLEVSELTPARRVVRVVRGGARFDVAHTGERLFRVEIRDVVIDVLGTAFTAEELSEHVRVAVERGRVQVTWGARKILLRAGESARFPPEEAPLPAREEPVLPAPAPLARQPAHRPVSASEPIPWRALARQGHFAEAYRVLDQGALRAASRPDARTLLLAADVARLSGHPREAVPHLEAVLGRFARDARAPLAAFTLGLVQLESLGAPAEAATAFARARRLDPRGELAEDALAREVEAWHRAGDSPRARRLAREYFERYPRGRRAGSVRSYGELP